MTAYELADDAKNISNTIEALEFVQKAVPMLRQQAHRIAELEKDLHMVQRHYDQLDTQTKPLSDEEIAKEWSKFYPDVFHTHLIDFVRAIEERHGIK